MKSETLVVERLPLSSNQIHPEEPGDLIKRDIPERQGKLRDSMSNKLSISIINNAWQESLVGDRTVKPTFPESRAFPLNAPTEHRKPESSEAGGGNSYSVLDDYPSASYGPPRAAAATYILQSPLPETRSGAPRQTVPTSPVVQSSLSETRESASQNTINAAITDFIVQSPQLASPDYSNPRKVPGTDQNIYPRAPINPEFHERYPQLVDFFKQAVDNHKFLKYHTSKINYELRLCGSTPSNAVASVIIFCTEALFKVLRSLLNSKHIQRQYQPIKPSLLEKFQFSAGKPCLQTSAPTVAPFKIVFWREATTPTQRRSTMEQVVAKNHSYLTMCGSLVSYGDRTSTLGLLVGVDSRLYGLTVDHLFKNQEQPRAADESDMLTGGDDLEENQADCPWIDDVKYEDLENDGWGLDNEPVTSGSSHVKGMMDHGLSGRCSASITGHKVDSLHSMDAATPYLDWALIEFHDGYYQRPNAFYPNDDLLNPKFLSRLSAPPKTSEVGVFMISGVSGVRTGVMLSGNSYIGGKPGEQLCQTWNLILSDSRCVIGGDCGSLIVDQETFEVYGQVVASNPLGEAYIVPLQNIFHQISKALGANDVYLPSPRLLTENLVDYYSKADDNVVKDEVSQILAAMEGIDSSSTQHFLQDELHPTFASRQTLNPKPIDDLDSLMFVYFTVRIERLPVDITEGRLRSMVPWAKDFIVTKMIAPEELDDPGFCSAILRFGPQQRISEVLDDISKAAASGTQITVENFFKSSMPLSDTPKGSNSSDIISGQVLKVPITYSYPKMKLEPSIIAPATSVDGSLDLKRRHPRISPTLSSPYEGGPLPSCSFLFSVNELQINDNPDEGGTLPLTDQYGSWMPPVYRNGFRIQAIGNLYRWSDGIISAATDCPWFEDAFRTSTSGNAPLTMYRDSTLFFCNGQAQFKTVRGNACDYDIANEVPPQWWPLSFCHDGEGISRIALEYTEEYIPAHSLEWLNALGLSRYTRPDRLRTVFGGLSGDLSMLIGLVAFSCQAKDLDSILLVDQAWQGFQWHGHNRRPGRDDQRGVVVNVYLDPANRLSSTLETIYALEFGGPALIQDKKGTGAGAPMGKLGTHTSRATPSAHHPAESIKSPYFSSSPVAGRGSRN